MSPPDFSDRPNKKLVLFDVDGTLTPARQVPSLDSTSPHLVNVLFLNRMSRQR